MRGSAGKLLNNWVEQIWGEKSNWKKRKKQVMNSREDRQLSKDRNVSACCWALQPHHV